MNQAFETTKRRLWVMRLIAMIIVPLVVLGGIELGLRLGGYGYDTSFFRRMTMNGEEYYVPNEKFSYRFFPPAIARSADPFRFAVEKGTNSYRIFLLGESAAMGDPDSTYGVGRYVEVLLRERYPGVEFQVVCVALTAIDSSTILPIARECARHQGDLWLIYMGNNEMVGPFGAETSYGFHAPNLGVIRTILAIKRTRIGELMDALVRRLNAATPKRWGGMEMFQNNRLGYDDRARLRAYANFRGNLEDILEAAHKASVPVILSTVAVDLKDCAPFASVHEAGISTKQLTAWNEYFEEGITNEAAGSNETALVWYGKAAQIDPRFAELEYRLGRCELALSNDVAARADFEVARDDDALDFRADSRINGAIREAAEGHAGEGVYLLDAARVLAEKSPEGIPGLNVFYEHVHLNFAGNYELALNMVEAARKVLPDSVTMRDKGSWATAELCDRHLAVTVWDRRGVWQRVFKMVTLPPFTGQYNHAEMVKVYEAKLEEVEKRMNSQTPEQVRRIYEQAIAWAPDDSFLHLNFVAFLQANGFLVQAIEEAKRCCELIQQSPDLYYHTATLMVRGGREREAGEYFKRAIAINGEYVEALEGLGEMMANEQKTAEAVEWFKRAIRADPKDVKTYIDLGFLEQGQGETAAALANYQKAAGLEPEGAADYFNQANVAASQYRWDEAVEDLGAVLKAEPEFWQARYQLGIQLAGKGDAGGAQAEFEEVTRERPDYVPAHFDLGTALATQGKFEPALAEYQTVLQLDPANSSAQQQVQIIKAKLHVQ